MTEGLDVPVSEVDCASCAAPCCRNFTPWPGCDLTTDHSHPSAESSRWASMGYTHWAPIKLEFVGWERHDTTEFRGEARECNKWLGHFNCSALVGNKCSAYETRPGACRAYDCRTDRSEREPGAYCDWPRG